MGSQSLAPTRTILLAEDYDDLRAVLIAVLRQPGVQVISASSGAEALQKANAHNGTIDLILTDIDMPPGVDGIQLARRLHEDRPGLRVLLISGRDAPDELGRGWAFLRKPFRMAVLIEKIEALMG